MQELDDPGPEGDFQDRLIHVENSLYFLKARARCVPGRDNGEIERLERLRQDLRSRCEVSRQQGAPRRRGDIPRHGVLPAAASSRPGKR